MFENIGRFLILKLKHPREGGFRCGAAGQAVFEAARFGSVPSCPVTSAHAQGTTQAAEMTSERAEGTRWASLVSLTIIIREWHVREAG